MITTSGSDNCSVSSVVEEPKLPVMADSKGRVRVTKEQRREILAALAHSGEPLPQFARRTGLKYSTLANWVQHSRGAKSAESAPRLRLLEAVVQPTQVTGAGALLLQLPGGVRVEVADEKQATLAAALVQALAKPC